MSAHLPDAGNASIIGSGTTAATVTATSAMGWINEYAVFIGLLISFVALVSGVFFNIVSNRKREALRAEDLRRANEEIRMRRMEFDALTAMVESVITRDGIERRESSR